MVLLKFMTCQSNDRQTMLMTKGYFRPKPNHFAKKKLFFPREASSAVFLPLPRVVLWLAVMEITITKLEDLYTHQNCIVI